ncbi:GPP34 family phosphoprotein [Arthrobacter sp. ov118]|uniref:GOLPH3/VPS74 family protein n=1 Tax=Arthrobacter sp. ov118 TaxID=1761747 RepID=UPI0008EAE95F|nr:GPP34 family phosphoprotein [Arthrobacter sp. ov118]SFT53518.1 Golgi phosphoprotein 3 (GPP34) [Arthrobacter sp. ov118]
MNAEMPMVAELNLPQAFLLLATNDQDGTPEVPMYALRTTLAGAILAELDLIGAIGLQGKRVRATGTAPQTDFQHELELIRGKSRPHTPKRWVSMLEGRAEVQRVYEGLAALGIVEHVGERHLGLFRTVRYPEKDHAPAAALLKKIQAALSAAPSDAGTPDSTGTDAGTPDGRTTALIALLQAAGLLSKLVPAADKIRASELAKDYWPSHAVEDELRMIRLAEEEEPGI